MTLSTRNRFLVAAFIATIPAIGILAVLFPDFGKAAGGAVAAADLRAGGPLTSLLEFVAKPSAGAVLLAVPLACVYAAGTIAMLY
jgi:hypothetical protein